MKKLPIGIQTFEKIIKDEYAYVDKTKFAYDLIENEKYYFLARPRRFGKSLFVDTLQNIFEGRKELFKDLYIYDKYNWQIKYPVIKISFSGVKDNAKESMLQVFNNVLQANQERFNVTCKNNDDIAGCFEKLIKDCYNKYKQEVVVLIDEYDKLILDVIEDVESAKIARGLLKAFYTVLKENDKYLKFVFLTGVSKFSKVSIFSGLNNVVDITLDDDYADICGYSQNDLETVFAEHLKNVDMPKVKLWYNGYNFNGDKVYNPYDILLFIRNKFVFNNYWFQTGTPTFLIKLIKKYNYFIVQLSNLVVDNALIDSFDIENIRLESILFQAGYLSIKEIKYDRDELQYVIGFPNLETRKSFNNHLIDYLTNQYNEKTEYRNNLYDCLCEGDLEGFKQTLTSLFASIPYNNYVNNNISSYEGYFASVIYAYIASTAVELISEDVTNKGRIDLTIKINKHCYILEFKVGKEAKAIEQIKEKNYIEKYIHLKDLGWKMYIIGIDFNEKEKNIYNMEWQEV